MRKIVVLAIAGLLVGCVQHNPASYRPVSPAQTAPEKPTYKTIGLTKEVEAAGTAKVRDSLKDPESAQFTGLYAATRIDGGGPPVLCGFVNAKNSYGGYVGKKAFMATDRIAAIWEDSPAYGVSVNNVMIKRACTTR